ncbi:XisH family protein [Limnothrix sp. FACHB-708]|uniref:XisH family protein n=1 Tax=unclassified Limnothrix TaxID=2632864 RepID=UPI0016842807|nr:MULTISPECIES: XisH family protein [unclassified Limnothrix]MBD2552725.1 XisH family protein [Limnothrix sp. FACHB-708]MBD2589995.1 XisH family protein [Limnothrix sp. FACHB-406]
MSRRDLYHDTVRNALEKDGWTITHDPLPLGDQELLVFADLGAEKLLAAQRGLQKIAVEVKVLGGVSTITELQKAIGQYGLYRYLLERDEPERRLYLAVPQEIYSEYFSKEVIQGWLIREQIQLLIFDPELEVLQWLGM